MNFIVVFRKELQELWRTYRFLVVVAVLAVFGLTSPLLAKFTPQMLKAIPGVPAGLLDAFPVPTVTDAIAQYAKNMSQFGILLALLVTMGVVVQEKERGTAAFFLTRPVSRETFVMAKFAALAVIFFASLALAAIGCWYYTYVLFQPLAWGSFLAMNGLMLVVFLVYMALSLLGSVLARSQGIAVGLAVLVLVIIGLGGSIPVIGDYFPGRLFSWGMALMMGGKASAWPAFWIGLGIIAVALLAACLIFRRQEI
jgi:ABC-2 type transport system permease protein